MAYLDEILRSEQELSLGPQLHLLDKHICGDEKSCSRAEDKCN